MNTIMTDVINEPKKDIELLESMSFDYFKGKLDKYLKNGR